jgi:miniconductance mechanosensitive channel
MGIKMSELLSAWTSTDLSAWMGEHNWIYTAGAALLLLAAAWISNLIGKHILVRGLLSLLNAQIPVARGEITNFAFIPRLANVIPALVITFGIRFVPNLPDAVVIVVLNVANAFIVLTIALAIVAVLDMVNDIYQRRPDAATRPIKGYIQVVTIVVYAIAVLLMIATLLDRSPVILLSGLGALAAVLMLVFQDTILSLVASVQITSNDIVRVGDWVEMPQLNADGDVIDIALHTVKIQNWDRTITTIPTKRFISDSFKNWRGMQESGGRRIKRAVYLDQTSVHFLSKEEKEKLGRFSLLRDYLRDKQKEIDEWNSQLADDGKEPVNTRRITNLGTFRAYLVNYLRSSERVRQDMTMIVRLLGPGPEGVPLEIYCFTNTIQWVAYEGIQSDIFDHVLSILPEFGLRVFQQPSGEDFKHVLTKPQEVTQ